LKNTIIILKVVCHVRIKICNSLIFLTKILFLIWRLWWNLSKQFAFVHENFKNWSWYDL